MHNLGLSYQRIFNEIIIIWVKIYKHGTFIEACFDIFWNKIIQYVITNEEPVRFWKKIIQIQIIDKICYPLI